jgi:hypothetical protein
MNRSIKRRYAFSQPEVREILLWWMQQKDLQRPQYTGDTDSTAWSVTDDGGIGVEWIDDDQIELDTGKPLR